MKNTKKIRRIVSWVLAGYLLFLFLSCVVPPLLPGGRGTAPEIQQAADVGERVRCIDDNEDALLWRLKLIEQAQENLIFATFSWVDDETGSDIMAALQHAADRGVRVQVICDGISGLTSLKLSKNFRALAATPGVEAKIYNPIRLLQPWKANYRMHDKYIVADDHLYLLGGRNTKNLSLGSYPGKRDIDRDVLVYSPNKDEKSSLNQVKNYFDSVWNLKDSKAFRPLFRAKPRDLQNLRSQYERLRSRYPEALQQTDWYQVTIPTGGIQLLHNSNHAGNKTPDVWNELVTLAEKANDRILQTPYLICSQQMYEDLYRVCLGGGKTSILLNSVESGANTFGSVDYLNQKANIRKIGVELYEFMGENSSHAKTMLLDDDISVIGSFNCDSRSAYLDTELMLVIRSRELNENLRQLLGESMEASRHVQPEAVTGSDMEQPLLSAGRKLLFTILRLIEPPFRHLL